MLELLEVISFWMVVRLLDWVLVFGMGVWVAGLFGDEDMRIKHLFILFFSVVLTDVQASSICDELRADGLAYDGERHVLLDLCNAELHSHIGSIITVEGRFLTVPKEFYVSPVEDQGIKLTSAATPRALTLEDIERWPYGSITISKEIETPSTVYGESVESFPQQTDALSRMCEESISIHDFGYLDREHLRDVQVVTLKIGDTTMRMFRGTPVFALVLAETYARLSC